MVVTAVMTLVLTAFGLLDESMLTGPRPDTAFIYQPDVLSFVVAFLAGVAGMLSLTSAKSGALVGVLISVTTVPAAANVAVAAAYGNAHEAAGSALQLALNLAGIVMAGTLTLVVQQQAWRRVPGTWPRPDQAAEPQSALFRKVPSQPSSVDSAPAGAGIVSSSVPPSAHQWVKTMDVAGRREVRVVAQVEPVAAAELAGRRRDA